MKRHGGLFARVVSTANLWRAWRELRRGKRSRASVVRFEAGAERAAAGLHRELEAGSWHPGGYRLLGIRDPKRRLIAAAPVADRVVHHAVHRVLAPLLDPGLIDTTFACLPGRGSHRAILAFLAALRRHRFVLLLDIRHYFLTIDTRIVLALMRRRLKDERLLELLAVILRSGEGLYERPDVRAFLDLPAGLPPAGAGLPIGNLTSQWWGNHYLSGFDHFVKRDLKVPHYQRYMDDLALFSDSRAELVAARARAIGWLRDERRLALKDEGAPVRECSGRFRYLGYRIAREGLLPGERALDRLRQRIERLVVSGEPEQLERSLASYHGILLFPLARSE